MDELGKDCIQFFTPEGELTNAANEVVQDDALLLKFYRAMTKTRAFDGKAIALQRTGQLGTFASALGQEAIGVGVAFAMKERDVLLPSYRDHAAQFIRGVTMTDCLLYWGGNERGSDYAGPRADFPVCVPVATQVAHAVGVAYSFLLRRQDRVAVCLIGDGGTANGGFYEAMNMAGVWKIPLIAVISNNGWAISTPSRLETATETFAQKSIAFGIEGVRVDGNDVAAVYDVARRAIDSARGGKGPMLIEAVTYRLGDHTTADDSTRYRDPEALRCEWKREPIARLKAYLTRRGAWSPEREAALLKACSADVEDAVAAYLATPAPTCDAMFDRLYETLPASMHEQIEEARRFAQHREGDDG